MSLAGAAERRQVPVYLATIAAAVLLGLTVPGPARGLEPAVEPVLALLLYATFLAVPFAELGRSLRDGRFVAAVLVLNFLIVPVVVWALLAAVPDEPAVRLGVLLVLLAPCIDYVIVFAGLAGGSARRLLAVAPLLMLVQVLLLPVYLLLLLGPDLATVAQPGPFVRAFVVLIALPLSAAVATELLGKRHRAAAVVRDTTAALMVPLMAATLLTVIASQVPDVVEELSVVARVMPVFAVFAAVLAVVGALTARVFRLEQSAGIALAFSGATRNSLVVLPLALAVPEAYAMPRSSWSARRWWSCSPRWSSCASCPGWCGGPSRPPPQRTDVLSSTVRDRWR